MPANQLSLRLTDRWRDQLRTLRGRVERSGRADWQLIDRDDLDGTFERWVELQAQSVATVQQATAGVTAAYLSAFATSEIGFSQDVRVAADPFVGNDQFGRPLREALQPALISVKAALADGKSVEVGLREGLNRALMISGEAIIESALAMQFAAMAASPIFEDSWRRVPRGTCAACLSDTTGESRPLGEPLNRHPNCVCVGEGKVRGVRERVERPTGEQILADMPTEAMVAQFGPEKAALLSAGEITLADLTERHALALGGVILAEGSIPDDKR